MAEKIFNGTIQLVVDDFKPFMITMILDIVQWMTRQKGKETKTLRWE